jgi:tRNA(Met) cytidine acetyltransferase
MAPPVAWQRTLEEGLRQAAERRHRLLLLNTSALPQEALLEALWPNAEQRAQVLTQSQAPLAEALGLETEGLCLNEEAPDFAERLPALAGTLRAGGLLALHLPRDRATPFQRWISQRLAPWAYTLRGDENPHLLPPSAPDAPTPAEAPPSADGLLDRLARALTGRGHRPALVLGGRGRGKSTLLGQLAARAPHAELAVTGPHPHSTAMLRRVAAAEGRPLPHRPPDLLLREGPLPEALLIDEAAGLPLPTLNALLEAVPRVVLATTTEGYEGTGQGLRQRFLGAFRERYREGTVWTLQTPHRFAADDPLEAALNAVYSTPEASHAPWPAPEGPGRLPPDAPEAAWTALYHCLRDAHYRARPRDLAQLFDDSTLERWVLGRDGGLRGALLLKPEGGHPRALAQAVVQGQRRPPGHHGASILGAQLGLVDALTLKSLRVQRLAITPDHRGRGEGAALVTAARASAASQGYAYLSVSFGATEALVRFWHRCGFRLARLGHRAGNASGAPSVLMVAPLSPAGQQMMLKAAPLLREELRFRLGPTGPALTAGLRTTLLQHLPGQPAPSAGAEQACARWLAGEVVLEEVGASVLFQLEKALRGQGAPAGPALQALTERLCLGAPWANLSEALGLEGRRATEGALRDALKEALREA